MAEPVLVVHGVANRDELAFRTLVQTLAGKFNGEFNFIPVYWGNMGAEVLGLQETLPEVAGLRSATGEDVSPELVAEVLSNLISARTMRADDEWQLDVVARAAEGAISREPTGLRRGDDTTEAVREALEESWANTQWLRMVSNEQVLEAVGRTIGTAVANSAGEDADDIRFRQDLDRRGVFDDLKGFAGSLLSELDKLTGAVIGEAVGKINQDLRGGLLPNVTKFLGDVVVYRRRSLEIQKRLWEEIEQHAPGYGTEERPIYVIAHSLGGLVSFDAATVANHPLWIKALVTFGSQAALFHVLDPRRNEGLPAFTPGRPVQLGPTIGRWTNLWEPMDLLAFITAKVFRLHNGEPPEDRRTAHLTSTGLVTHSSYWASPELVQAILDTLV